MEINWSDTTLFERVDKQIECGVKPLVGKFGITTSDLEDLKHDFWIELHHRAARFKSDKSKLITFIARVIEHKKSDVISYRLRGKRDYRRIEYSMEDLDLVGERTTTSKKIPKSGLKHLITRPRGAFGDTQNLRIDIAEIVKKLPINYQHLCNQLMAGSSKARAAREMGFHVSMIHEWCDVIRKRIRESRILS